MKNRLRIWIYSILVSISMPLVSARVATKLIPDSVWESIAYFLSYLPGSSEKYIYFKFLLWIMFFAIIRTVIVNVPPFKGGDKH